MSPIGNFFREACGAALRILDQTVDTVLNPVEEAFGVRKHSETHIFEDLMHQEKSAPAQSKPEIDYGQVEAKAIALSETNSAKPAESAQEQSSEINASSPAVDIIPPASENETEAVSYDISEYSENAAEEDSSLSDFFDRMASTPPPDLSEGFGALREEEEKVSAAQSV